MKTFCLVIALCLVLDSYKLLAFAPAPAILVTNAETGEITYRYPTLESMNRSSVRIHHPVRRSLEQTWFQFWDDVDAFGPSREIRIVALSFLFFFLYHKSEQRRKKEYQANRPIIE